MLLVGRMPALHPYPGLGDFFLSGLDLDALRFLPGRSLFVTGDVPVTDMAAKPLEEKSFATGDDIGSHVVTSSSNCAWFIVEDIAAGLAQDRACFLLTCVL